VPRSLVYDVDEVPPLREGLALGAQHLVAMLLGNITPPLLIAGALGLAAGQTGILVQAVLLVAGLSTLVQAYPIGPVGGRIPIVMGISIAFVGGSIAVGSRAGLATRCSEHAWWQPSSKSSSASPSHACGAGFRRS
jgi:NCS2 family nucleobase:cation symporter-2